VRHEGGATGEEDVALPQQLQRLHKGHAVVGLAGGVARRLRRLGLLVAVGTRRADGSTALRFEDGAQLRRKGRTVLIRCLQ